jgi:GntR family transcriptional regulator of vanillate catabolism
MILRGELAPGQQLRDADLAKRLDAPRVLVRDSLPMLLGEGMLTRLDTGGLRVRSLAARDVDHAIEVSGVLEALAARMLSEQGAPPRLIRALNQCLDQGDEIFAKGHLVSSDQARYGEMNRCLHSLIVQGADSKVVAEAIGSNSRIPFAAAHAIAFEKSDLTDMFDSLRNAHLQHHAIVQAIEDGEGARAAALVYEHALERKVNIRLPCSNRIGLREASLQHMA